MRLPNVVLAVLFLSAALAGCFGEPEDDDGLSCDVEQQGYEITIERVDGTTETRRVTSSCHHADLDQDGLDDMQERLERTDPRSPDTDGDGLLDADDMRVPADDDRVADWQELGIRHREAEGGDLIFLGERGDTEVRHGGDPADEDTDDDGIIDGDEVGGFTMDLLGAERTVTTLAYTADTDGDGLRDGFERDRGLDPTDQDTDGDGVPDLADVNPYQDVRLRFEASSLRVDEDPDGRNQLPVSVDVQLPDERFQSPSETVRRGETTNSTAWESDRLAPGDTGGNFMAGQHNMSFSITFLSASSGGEPRLLDLTSETAGGGLIGQLNAMTGELRLGPSGTEEWPEDGRFKGPHGSVVIRLLMDPPPGQ